MRENKDIPEGSISTNKETEAGAQWHGGGPASSCVGLVKNNCSFSYSCGFRKTLQTGKLGQILGDLES